MRRIELHSLSAAVVSVASFGPDDFLAVGRAARHEVAAVDERRHRSGSGNEGDFVQSQSSVDDRA